MASMESTALFTAISRGQEKKKEKKSVQHETVTMCAHFKGAHPEIIQITEYMKVL